MKNRNNGIFLILTALIFACSCSYNKNSYSCFSDIDPIEGWDYGKTYVYLPEIGDSLADGTLALLVRHTNDYPYSNLWVEVESQSVKPDGHLKISCDTFCIDLADVYGNWYGRGQGTTFEKTDTLYINYTLINHAPIRLRHVMRPERVMGIEKVGLIFTANSDEK
ncbi:MAG: gliding motility lipoprotein GldH [Bacteroides sp.]|nr:gliding motility lipoprotein GldH [Bacteroides sp.]MCM1378590.1 gliding motility lipoprotein GldH [Bacteroides sp.]MCM1444891.1 gliding motility lipoprotein GldH [Prevotella sp.]